MRDLIEDWRVEADTLEDDTAHLDAHDYARVQAQIRAREIRRKANLLEQAEAHAGSGEQCNCCVLCYAQGVADGVVEDRERLSGALNEIDQLKRSLAEALSVIEAEAGLEGACAEEPAHG